jgi:GNAT superfamily N-acetyltransferase
VYYDGLLVAYYTLSNSSLKCTYVEQHKGFSRLGEFRLEELPAFTIGRLAVAKDWQKKGIGRVIVVKIVDDALACAKHAGIRLILVQAKHEAFDFYQKLGFEFVKETRREKARLRDRGTRTMFLDILHVEGTR